VLLLLRLLRECLLLLLRRQCLQLLRRERSTTRQLLQLRHRAPQQLRHGALQLEGQRQWAEAHPTSPTRACLSTHQLPKVGDEVHCVRILNELHRAAAAAATAVLLQGATATAQPPAAQPTAAQAVGEQLELKGVERVGTEGQERRDGPRTLLPMPFLPLPLPLLTLPLLTLPLPRRAQQAGRGSSSRLLRKDIIELALYDLG
jgi:hypothetical protein